MALRIPCNTTIDCRTFDKDTPRVCSQVFKGVDGDSFCECSSFFGWVGDSCNETSNFLVYLRISSVILILMGLFVVIVTLRVLVLNSLMKGVATLLISIIGFNIILSASCLILFISVRFISNFNPTYIEFVVYDSVLLEEPLVDVDTKFALFLQASALLGMCASVLAAYFLMIKWQELGTSISSFNSYMQAKSSRRKATILKVLLLFVSIILMLLITFRDLLLGLVSMGAIIVVLTITFLVISGKVVKQLKSLPKADKDKDVLLLTISIIQRTRTRLISCWIIISIIGCLYVASFEASSTSVSPGSFNLTALSRDLAYATAFLYLSLMAWYINSISVAPIVGETYCPYTCSLFRVWDKMNTRLIPEYSGSEFVISSRLSNLL